MFKSLSLKDWLNYSQVYSEPGLHLETTATYGSPEWNAAIQAVEDFRREFRIVTSTGQKFNPIEFSKTGDAPFAPMVDRMDRRMSGIILGGDMLTMSRHGANNSGASLQKDQGEIILDGDCELVTETLNAQISRLVIREVFGTDEPLAEIIITPEVANDVNRDIKVDTFLLQSGAKLSVQDMLARYDRSEAEDGDELATAPPTAKADAETRGQGDAESASNDQITTGLNDDLAPLRMALERIVKSSNDDELASAAHNLSANFPHIITAVMAGEHGTGALNRVIAQNLLAGLEGADAQSNDHWVTVNGEHVLIKDNVADAPAPSKPLSFEERRAAFEASPEGIAKRAAKEKEKNKWKMKAQRADEKKAAAIAPGTHDRMAESAIADAEAFLKSGKSHVIEASDMLRSHDAITRNLGLQMHDSVISPAIHVGGSLDSAASEIYHLGRIGKDVHPEAMAAFRKIQEAKRRLIPDSE
jgi:hypothetical protein